MKFKELGVLTGTAFFFILLAPAVFGYALADPLTGSYSEINEDIHFIGDDGVNYKLFAAVKDVAYCTETDNGLNSIIKGEGLVNTTNGISNITEEACNSKHILTEYACGNDISLAIDSNLNNAALLESSSGASMAELGLVFLIASGPNIFARKAPELGTCDNGAISWTKGTINIEGTDGASVYVDGEYKTYLKEGMPRSIVVSKDSLHWIKISKQGYHDFNVFTSVGGGQTASIFADLSLPDSFKFSGTGSEVLNYGETIGEVFSVPLNFYEMPNLLSDGVYAESKGATHNHVSYVQQLQFGGLNSRVLFDQPADGLNSDDYLEINNNEMLYRYELMFDNDVEFETSPAVEGSLADDLIGTYLIMQGQAYEITDVAFHFDGYINDLTFMKNGVEFQVKNAYDTLNYPAGTIEIDGVEIADAEVAITQNGPGTWSGVIIEYTSDDDVFLSAGQEFTDPVMQAFKLVMNGSAVQREGIVLDVKGDERGELSFVNNEGKIVKLPFRIETQGNNELQWGEGDDEPVLIEGDVSTCQAAANIDDCEGTMLYAISPGKAAHVIEIVSIDTWNNEIDLKSLTYGRVYSRNIVEGLNSIDLGSLGTIDLTLDYDCSSGYCIEATALTAGGDMIAGTENGAEIEIFSSNIDSGTSCSVDSDCSLFRLVEDDIDDPDISLEGAQEVEGSIKYDSADEKIKLFWADARTGYCPVQGMASWPTVNIDKIYDDSEVLMSSTAHGTLIEYDDEDKSFLRILYPDEEAEFDVFIESIA